eukprot:GHVR01181015.1.p1 GENE.GHVR01181015.1~~GHVR01181015.1.p1  ORF type:complete len:142 (+),score=9.25 GHVR01181015.1:99-524(+)
MSTRSYWQYSQIIGVGIVTWDEFQKNDWHLLYPKLVLRRLYYNRTEQNIKALSEFCKEVVGKVYKLSPKKLMRRNSSGSHKDFFCSELVANAWKVFGVLPLDKPGSQYWPSTFAHKSRKKLTLANGAELGQELLIDFNILT